MSSLLCEPACTMSCYNYMLWVVNEGVMGYWQNDNDRWKLKYSEKKPVPVPLCLLHISYGLAWDWYRGCVVSAFNSIWCLLTILNFLLFLQLFGLFLMYNKVGSVLMAYHLWCVHPCADLELPIGMVSLYSNVNTRVCALGIVYVCRAEVWTPVHAQICATHNVKWLLSSISEN